MNEDNQNDIDLKMIARQRRRKAEMRRKRERRRKIRIAVFLTVLLLIVMGIVFGIVAAFQKITGGLKTKPEEGSLPSSEESFNAETTGEGTLAESETALEIETEPEALATSSSKSYLAAASAQMTGFDGEVISSYALLIDRSTETILAERNSMTRISPASMTKILTLLVAAEHVTNLDDTFTITKEITDFSYKNGCSSVGFLDGETVTVRDLFYGTILPSGGDAAAALATYVAGSQEEFVSLMNDKIAELGLSGSAHFTNCVGLYDDNHYCTPYDMAMILEAAVDQPFCKEVLSAHKYTTSQTPEHPEGIEISNWFLRRIEDKDSGGTVLCAKTGYVVQSGNCAASYAEDASGKGYICVTANATSSWRCIYDHVAIYKKFLNSET